MRRTYPIPGGIHPQENKSRSLGASIRSAGLPDKLILPLAQHIGAPSRPVVQVGDQVLKGQVIAAADGFVSVPCHAPTSGRIGAIGKHPIAHPSGLAADCITLVPDRREQWAPRRATADYRALDRGALLQLIREAGIAGMGGAGFPSSVKLATDKKIDTLIINGTECEPYITADDMLMRSHAEQIIEGVSMLRHLVAPGETVIGIEDNKPEAIEIMRNAAAGTGIELATFPTRYPSGGEKQLIQILTGREVPSGGLPADIGIVLQNIGTAHAVYRAVAHGEPLLQRITTVTGDAVSRPGNYQVLLGTPIEHLLDLAGFDPARGNRLIMGGPMMGFALTSTEVPVVKTTNCILAPTLAEMPTPPPAQACIRCGMCAEACPASLLPQQLYWFARGKEFDKLEAHNLFDCIECGCCSYVCPSNIPLVQYYRASKASIAMQRADSQKSGRAKERFETRQLRLEQEQAQREARRQARKAKAPPGKKAPARTQEVQAAIARSEASKRSADAGQSADSPGSNKES